MIHSLSLLVVDISEAWEEEIKRIERGYDIDWEPWLGKYQQRGGCMTSHLAIHYPHGSVRAGLNAIVDTARIAAERGIPSYAVHYYTGNSDGEEQTCFSLQPYIPENNRYEKQTLSAFHCPLADRLVGEGCRHLVVIGYDRDDCVMETIKDAVARGITVVTSEHCMLTRDADDRRVNSLEYFRKNTVFLETLVDVWNYIRHAPVSGKR